MAGFRKDKTTAAQTSANVAGSVVTALIEKGEVDLEDSIGTLEAVFDSVFARIAPVVDSDNALFAETEAADPAPARERKTSGGSRSSSSSSGKPQFKGTLKDAYKMAFKGGAFEGVTLKQLLDIDADTADSEYDYGDGERGGREYIAWAASDKNDWDYTRVAARLVADAEGIDYN